MSAPASDRRRRPRARVARPTPAPAGSRRRRARPGPLAIVLGVAAVAGVAGAVVVATSGDDPAAGAATTRTATVNKGIAESLVSGTGNLAPSKQLDLDFGTSGKVTHVYVKAGDHVVKDQLLARLDRTSAKVALQAAQAQLDDAEQQLATVPASSTTTTTSTTTTASTASAATVTYEPVALLAAASPTPTPTPTPGATTTPTPSPTPTPTPRATPTPTPTPRATPTPSSQVGSGGAAGGGGASGGAGAGGGTAPTSAESAQAAVATAQLAVQEAEDALAATDLRAPMAGTVASVTGQVGDQVSAGGSTSGTSGDSASGTAGGGQSSGSGASSSSTDSSSGSFVTLVKLHTLTMDVELSESDIGSVKVGQSATVTVNALEGQETAAHVSAIGVLPTSSSSSGSSGAVSYPVTVVLDQGASGVRAGMSATADIVTGRASGLVVPNQAVQGGMVTVDRDGVRTQQRVQTGVVGDTSTQILSGLQQGDTVVVTSASAMAGQNAGSAAQVAGQGAGARFGGGGFGGAGGGLRPGGGAGGGNLRPGGGGP